MQCFVLAIMFWPQYLDISKYHVPVKQETIYICQLIPMNRAECNFAYETVQLDQHNIFTQVQNKTQYKVYETLI